MLPVTVRAVGGRDNEGFVEISSLRERARHETLEAFVEAFAAPALVTISVEGEGQPVDEGFTPRTAMKLLSRKSTAAIESGLLAGAGAAAARSPSRYYRRVAFLSKRPGNHFPLMISVGRAMNNDVVFLFETISKFHGYFIRQGDHWTFTDQRSSNGTLVNGRRLAHGVASVVEDGDRLTFGGNLETKFLLPAALHRLLQETAS